MKNQMCWTLGELILNARNAGRQGHLVLSYDDPGNRFVGFRDVDADVLFEVPLTRVMSMDEWGGYKPKPGEEGRSLLPAPAEPWRAILRSINSTKDEMYDLIKTVRSRGDLASRLSGRTGTLEEVKANDAMKAERDRLFMEKHKEGRVSK